MNSERIVFFLMRLVSYSIVAVVAYILLHILWHALPGVTWKFLTEYPRGSGGGIFPAIAGTVYLVAGALAVALPLGVGSAIYLSEYSHRGRFARTIRLAIVTLAGVPSVVYGLFGLGLFVIYLEFGTSVIAGSMTLACMILPMIIVSSEEALRAVPRDMREASLALGATRWQMIRTSVIPYAIPGMLTGSMLSVGRAAGETAPILLTAAAFFMQKLPESVFDQVMALPYHLFVLSTQYPETEEVVSVQYATALVLLVLVLGINLAAIILRRHFRKKYRW